MFSSFHELMQSCGVRRPSVCPSVCKHFAQVASSARKMAGSRPNLHTMVPRRACIQGVLNVKVYVKGHVLPHSNPQMAISLRCEFRHSSHGETVCQTLCLQYGLTFCLYMLSLYEAPLHSPSSIKSQAARSNV